MLVYCARRAASCSRLICCASFSARVISGVAVPGAAFFFCRFGIGSSIQVSLTTLSTQRPITRRARRFQRGPGALGMLPRRGGPVGGDGPDMVLYAVKLV